MNFNHIRCLVFLLLWWCSLSVPALAQGETPADREQKCANPEDISIWLNCRVDEIAAAKIQQRDPGKQVELPSIADNTTSLIDRSQAPDVLGFALNLAGLSPNSKEKEKTALSFTTTAYALYAAAIQRDPLNPAIYSRHPNLRRFSFTFGQETPEEGQSDSRATILGNKILIINGRDVSRARNRARFNELTPKLTAAVRDFTQLAADVQQYIYERLAVKVGLRDPRSISERRAMLIEKERFISEHMGTGRMAATLNLLTEGQLADITELITNRIESRVELDEANLRTIEEVRRAPQLAFMFNSKLREGNGNDEYRAGLTFDYGLYRRLNLTLNATFDYLDSKKIGGDTRGGRVAGETRFQLTPDRRLLGGAGPWMFSVSGEGKWMSSATSIYTGNLKLTIPIMDGVNFPLSVSFANRSDLIKESHVRGRFGFSFDLPKLIKGLH